MNIFTVVITLLCNQKIIIKKLLKINYIALIKQSPNYYPCDFFLSSIITLVKNFFLINNMTLDRHLKYLCKQFYFELEKEKNYSIYDMQNSKINIDSSTILFEKRFSYFSSETLILPFH